MYGKSLLMCLPHSKCSIHFNYYDYYHYSTLRIIKKGYYLKSEERWSKAELCCAMYLTFPSGKYLAFLIKYLSNFLVEFDELKGFLASKWS